MAARISSRLTYANVISTLALLLVLTGGSAYALAGHNSVLSDDIKNGEVKLPDAQTSAFGRGIQFGGISTLSNSASASYYPIGLNDGPVGSDLVVPVPMRLRDLEVDLFTKVTTGTRTFFLGVAGEDAQELICTISVGSSSCHQDGPSAVLKPGDDINFAISNSFQVAGGGSAQFSWRAATP